MPLSIKVLWRISCSPRAGIIETKRSEPTAATARGGNLFAGKTGFDPPIAFRQPVPSALKSNKKRSDIAGRRPLSDAAKSATPKALEKPTEKTPELA